MRWAFLVSHTGNVTAFYSTAFTLLISENVHSCLEIPQLWLLL